VKELNFIDTALDDLRNFPNFVRKEAGFQLRNIQNGFVQQTINL